MNIKVSYTECSWKICILRFGVYLFAFLLIISNTVVGWIKITKPLQKLVKNEQLSKED